MKKRFTGKSKDLRSDLVSGQTSRPYTRTGIHLLLLWSIKMNINICRHLIMKIKNVVKYFKMGYLNVSNIS